MQRYATLVHVEFSNGRVNGGMLFGASVTDNANVSIVRLGECHLIFLIQIVKESIQIDPNKFETIRNECQPIYI